MTRTTAPTSPRENLFPGDRTRSLQDDNAPIVMVVCADPERLRELRQRLRCDGFLTAAARSPDAALALLTQVQVDGCVVSDPLDESLGVRLARALNAIRPGCPKVLLMEAGSDKSGDWSVCPSAEVVETLRQGFRKKRG